MTKRIKKRKKLIFLTTIPLLAIGIFALMQRQAEAAWYNEKWRFRKKIEISYTGTATLTNHQIKLDEVDVDGLNSAGKLNSDCSDIRFTDANGALLKYWIADESDTADELDCTASDYDIWVKVPSIGFGGTHIYMYYGNPTAASESDGREVFEFFEDFDGSAVDTALWDSNGSPAVTGGNLELNDAGDAAPEGIVSKLTFCDSSPGNGDSCVVEFRAEQDATSLANARAGFSNTNDYGLAFDQSLTTFTAGAAKRNVSGAPFAGGVLVQGGASAADTIAISSGTVIHPNFNTINDSDQGSIVFWITPEWDGNDGETHRIFHGTFSRPLVSKNSEGELTFGYGNVSLSTDVSSWESGETYLVVIRWDRSKTIDGTNYGSISINDSHIYSDDASTGGHLYPQTTYIGSVDDGTNPANALIEGLTVYRRPLYDGTYGIDVGNGDEIAAIYNSGSGEDPTLTTGSWDVVFALPTNASTGALTTGEG
ncbi:DUF2341 domain-containing protein, partial [candidate division WWE3 bacterium]|nr:DUF2341 domain-containing protein [candidate division WWE3 bacterium]